MNAAYKRNLREWFIIIVLTILAVAVEWLAYRSLLQTQYLKDETGQDVSETNSETDIIKIEIILNAKGPDGEKLKPVSVTDTGIIQDILSIMEKGTPLEDEPEIKMSGIALRNNKLIASGADGSRREITFYYDTIYQTGYIDEGGRKVKPDYSFFRYVALLASPDTYYDYHAIRLFERYNWTIAYKINTLTEKLPDTLKHKAGEYPVKIYWAYNNELSKDIGLDFSGYLGKDVTVDIYMLKEPLPEFLSPQIEARGVVLKYNNEIIGAYIDAGRHNCFACSLDRKGLHDITGKEWDEWVSGYIDYEDELEIRLSKMEPEDIIREYYNALDKHDFKTVWACMTRKNLSKDLSRNMDNQYLFNREDEIDYNINSAKLLEVEMEEIKNEPGVLLYCAMVDFDFKVPYVQADGVRPRFVFLKKESEKSGWRIDSIGTGP